jgi:hypothetical protein|tara:strand:+ start:49 stop:372 length:324 start_codon:yes stop_codon:yes gene_type:complete
MHKLITAYFKKKGIEDVTNLSDEESTTFDDWERILSTESDITVDKIADFCRGQIDIIEGQWKDLDNKTIKNERLVIMHTAYSSFLKVIVGPKEERENLEKYLRDLIA